MKAELIAPCGFNCALCSAYQNKGVPCGGCNSGGLTQKHCQTCVIRGCETIKTNRSGFCYECAKYPCRRLRQLDARYQKQYNTSMLANLQHIKTKGMSSFLGSEEKRWACPSCGEIVCIHKRACLHCGAAFRQSLL